MEHDIVRKLRAELERGISTEPQVVYLMVKARKLLDLDRQRSTAAYSTLRLYCDWCVHVELRGPQAQDIVRGMDSLYPSMLDGTITEEGKIWLRDVFSFSKFRDELNQFLADYNLPTFSDSKWHAFLLAFLNTVEDCSLKCTANGTNLNNVDEVVIFKEGRNLNRTSDDSAPPLLWALCFRGKLKFPISANTPLSDEVEHALSEFGKRREALGSAY